MVTVGKTDMGMQEITIRSLIFGMSLLVTACASVVRMEEKQKAVLIDSHMLREQECSLSDWRTLFWDSPLPSGGAIHIESSCHIGYVTEVYDLTRTIRIEVAEEKSSVHYEILILNRRQGESGWNTLKNDETTECVDNHILDEVLSKYLSRATTIDRRAMKDSREYFEHANFQWSFRDKGRYYLGAYLKPFTFEVDRFFAELQEREKGCNSVLDKEPGANDES
jgi:hypothetical protein